MNTIRISLIFACAVVLAPIASSCEFHGGFGGGAFGTQWQPYDPGADSYDSDGYSYSDDSSEDTSEESETKARPVFSNSATRAANSAKESISSDDSDDDLGEQSTVIN